MYCFVENEGQLSDMIARRRNDANNLTTSGFEMAEILIGSNKKMFLLSGVLDFFSIDRIQEVLV